MKWRRCHCQPFYPCACCYLPVLSSLNFVVDIYDILLCCNFCTSPENCVVNGNDMLFQFLYLESISSEFLKKHKLRNTIQTSAYDSFLQIVFLSGWRLNWWSSLWCINRKSLIIHMCRGVQFFTVVAIGMVLEPQHLVIGSTCCYGAEGIPVPQIHSW